jgi:hypothetical protein
MSVTGFIEQLQIIFTCNYSGIANSHHLQFTISRTESPQPAMSSPLSSAAILTVSWTWSALTDPSVALLQLTAAPTESSQSAVSSPVSSAAILTVSWTCSTLTDPSVALLQLTAAPTESSQSAVSSPVSTAAILTVSWTCSTLTDPSVALLQLTAVPTESSQSAVSLPVSSASVRTVTTNLPLLHCRLQTARVSETSRNRTYSLYSYSPDTDRAENIATISVSVVPWHCYL